MITPSRTLAVSLLSSVLFLGLQAASAQTNSPPKTTATRPAQTGPDQTSLPNGNPPAPRTQTTGEADHEPKIQQMNEEAKSKVEREGK